MKNVSRYNYILMFLDTVLFVNAMAFISINSVIPYFLNNLGANTVQISLASALASIGSLVTQPVFSGKVMKLRYKIPTFVKILFTQRIFFLIFSLSIPVLASKSPSMMILLFLVFWGVFNLFVGSYSPFYMSIMPKLILIHHRGRLLGFSGALGNIVAVGSSVLIGVLLSRISYPYNYTVIFSIGTILLLLDVLDFHLMKGEPEDDVTDKELGYIQYFRDIPRVLKKDKKYFHKVIGYSFFAVTNISLAFYTIYAIRNFGAGAAEIALFTGISVAINILANIVLGIIADKHGHKHVLQFAALCGLAAGVIILIFHGIFSVYAALALSTICSSGYNLSASMFIIQEAPKKELPIYISVYVMITLLISSVVLMLSGVIIDKISFVPVFSMTMLAGLGAYILFKKVK